MATVKFTHEVPEDVVKILEDGSGKTAEEILEAHLTEWWFGKTHHEVELVKQGKHKKIKQDSGTLAMADEVHKVMCADQYEYTLDDIGVEIKTSKQIEALEATAKTQPKPPKPHGQMGDIQRNGVDKERWFREMIDERTDEEKEMPLRAFIAKKVKETEASPAFTQYREDFAEWDSATQYLADLKAGFPSARRNFINGKKFKPNVTREND